ncbi:hypothetical protein DAEQUDRAFT_764522 [Daedalea quercina L-15889]|uniref:Peptidase C14 caspase domain-containing protein n=1 Tax=Daedalea quercina L-15889 TaxID=1314783 RepID=A0A165REJ3_9APHY|nr:hypothetical protein DAEQUDRAFT_764522 [Daedalea quercina L-15889]
MTVIPTFALIVAIDRYQNPDIPRLYGCVNDGEDFWKFLVQTRRVPSSNICKLYNEKARRDDIIKTFREFLIQNSSIQQGSLIFFYYAGHGDRVNAPQNWNSEERKVETICPYDITLFGDGRRQINAGIVADARHGIPDWTIGALMGQLADKKGTNIVAIFDCCHSGGATRDLEAGTMRSLPEDGPLLRRLELPPDLDEDLFDRSLNSVPVRGLSLAVPSGFGYSGTTSHVLLAACQPGEKAREERGLGGVRGVFTYNLLACLRELSPKDESELTYVDLVERVARRLEPVSTQSWSPVDTYRGQAAPHVQRPHCEGRLKNRTLFGTSEAARADSFALSYKNSALYVDAGDIHGVVGGNAGTRFVASIPSPNHHDGVELVPTDVEAHQCRVQPVKLIRGHTITLDGVIAAATVLRWHSGIVKIRSHEQLLRSEGIFRFATPRSPSAYVDLVASKTERGCILERHDPLMGRFAKKTQLERSPLSNTVLMAIARFNYHLYRHRDDRPSSEALRHQLKIAVHLYPLQLHGWGLREIYQPIENSPDLFALAKNRTLSADVQSPYRLWRDEVEQISIRVTDATATRRFGLTLENESSIGCALFPYVFYFEPRDYSIEASAQQLHLT